MIDDTAQCNDQLLGLFVDGETSPEELRWVERHLSQCSVCRQYVQQQKQMAHQLRREVSRARQAVDFHRLEQQIVGQTGEQAALRVHWRERLLSWKLILPVAATAAMALVFFTNMNQSLAPPGPSAIINSFTGEVSSVMILETPRSHQTVIWYHEEALEGNGTESQTL